MERWRDGGASHVGGAMARRFFVKGHARIGDRTTPARNTEYACVFLILIIFSPASVESLDASVALFGWQACVKTNKKKNEPVL